MNTSLMKSIRGKNLKEDWKEIKRMIDDSEVFIEEIELLFKAVKNKKVIKIID